MNPITLGWFIIIGLGLLIFGFCLGWSEHKKTVKKRVELSVVSKEFRKNLIDFL